MKRLDIYHHKFIMALLILVVFVIGIFFGVKVSAAAGESAMQVLLFGLLFLNSVILYVLFTQIIHVRDDISKCNRPVPKKVKRK